VAAAVSSLFGAQLAAAGFAGGEQLRALVFLVIAMTVALQGATAGLVATLLRVRRPAGRGYAILGAQPLGRLLGGRLRAAGEPVIVIDAGSGPCREAAAEGLAVIEGNALEEGVLQVAETGSRKAVIGTLPNEAVNILFACHARDDYRVPRSYIVLPPGHGAASERVLRRARATLLGGFEFEPDLWSARLRTGRAALQVWRLGGPERADPLGRRAPLEVPAPLRQALLPLLWESAAGIQPVDQHALPAAGDTLHLLVDAEREDTVRSWLEESGWRRQPEATATGSARRSAERSIMD
jgi:voltage-gated potassium channel Kch